MLEIVVDNDDRWRFLLVHAQHATGRPKTYKPTIGMRVRVRRVGTGMGRTPYRRIVPPCRMPKLRCQCIQFMLIHVFGKPEIKGAVALYATAKSCRRYGPKLSR